MQCLVCSWIVQIWNSYPQESINELVRSFADRLQLLFSKNDESISDELRKGIDKIKGIEINIPSVSKVLNFDELIELYHPTTEDWPLKYQLNLFLFIVHSFFTAVIVILYLFLNYSYNNNDYNYNNNNNSDNNSNLLYSLVNHFYFLDFSVNLWNKQPMTTNHYQEICNCSNIHNKDFFYYTII